MINTKNPASYLSVSAEINTALLPKPVQKVMENIKAEVSVGAQKNFIYRLAMRNLSYRAYILIFLGLLWRKNWCGR